MAFRTPIDVHGVRTPEEYRAVQRDYVRRLKVARPALGVNDPYVASENPPVRILQGKVVVICGGTRNSVPCLDLVSVDPTWQLGCCLKCGAIYENVTMPDLEAIEAAIGELPRPAQNWSPE